MKDQPFLETYRISTTLIGKLILRRLFSHKNIMNFSQMKVASENLTEIPDSTSSIFVSYHAAKFSTWKHHCLCMSLRLIQNPIPFYPPGSEKRPIHRDRTEASSFHNAR